jgi:hypothetical protein
MKKLSRAQKTTLAKLAAAAQTENEEQHLSHHKRHCEICNHPACQFIQEAFLQWISPDTIMKKYDLKSRATIYHHAHAFRLFELRDSTLRFALGHIVEQADRVSVTARDVIQAVYTYAHVNDQGLWMQPESRSEVVVSRNDAGEPLPASPASLPNPDSALPRLPAKPAKRRRRPGADQETHDASKMQPEPGPDLAAAYVQVASPDPADPNALEDWRAVANRFFGKVPRPNFDPNSTETIYFDAYRTSPDPK